MAKTFRLEIVTPDGITFSDEVESCVLPGLEGSFGVLPGHAPAMSQLGIGEAKFIRVGGRVEYLALNSGFAQVDPSQVSVLAETAELAGQIDAARAKARLEEKGQVLKTTHLTTDQTRAIELSLLKEIVRLKVAGRGSNGA